MTLAITYTRQRRRLSAGAVHPWRIPRRLSSVALSIPKAVVLIMAGDDVVVVAVERVVKISES